MNFALGFVCGFIAVMIADLITGAARRGPHCGVCAKLAHLCQCKEGPR